MIWSPKEINLDPEYLNDWAKNKDGHFIWLPLKMERDLKKVVRCNNDGDKLTKNENGEYWKY